MFTLHMCSRGSRCSFSLECAIFIACCVNPMCPALYQNYKHLTSIDLIHPSISFEAWRRRQFSLSDIPSYLTHPRRRKLYAFPIRLGALNLNEKHFSGLWHLLDDCLQSSLLHCSRKYGLCGAILCISILADIFTGSSSHCSANRQRNKVVSHIDFHRKSHSKCLGGCHYYSISTHNHSTKHDTRYKGGQWLFLPPSGEIGVSRAPLTS